MTKKIVIIGGDAAGMSAASKAKKVNPDLDVIVFEKGPHISYAACGIPYYISGVVDDWKKLVILTPDEAIQKRHVDVRVHHEVLSIDPANRQVMARNLLGNESFFESYDKLIIATGAKPRVPQISGLDLPGVFMLRTIQDGIDIKSYIKENQPKSVVVVGGGYIGLEMVEAFRRLGLDVTVIEQLDRIMVSVDAEIATVIEEELHKNDVKIYLRSTLSGIKTDKDGSLALDVAGGPGKINADMVLISIGVQANADLAKAAGIRLGKRGGIRINEKMETTFANIYAAGDCAEYKHIVSGRNTYIPLAPAANKGGRVAGENAAGGNAVFPGILGTSITKIFDLEVARTGLSYRDLSETVYSKVKQISITEKNRAHYYPDAEKLTIRIIAEQRSNRILGAQIIGGKGTAKKIDLLALAIMNNMTLDDIHQLDLAYAPPFSPVYDPILIAANVGLRSK
jgi:NADPH-dependent 2,4-dienoyl-CoA reductase/sulfur reductase-like enzyme